MKKLFFLLIAVLSLTSFKGDDPFTGTWRGFSDGQMGMITFDKEGYVTFTIGKEKLGGKKLKVENYVTSMIYEFNEAADPKTLDFIIIDHKTKEEITRMSGIYKFINPNSMVLNLAVNGGLRPTDFDESSPDQIVLSKIK